MKKKIIFISLVLVVLFSSFAAAAEYKIGASVYGLQGEYMRLWSKALEQHPAVEEGLVEIKIFDGDYDASTQYGHFESMTTGGYDAILFVPIDVEAGAIAVDLAARNNIPVIGSNTKVDSDKLTSYIGSDDVKAGEMEAEAVAEAIDYEGNVVILEGPIGQSAQIDRREGNMNVLDEYPDIEVLEMKTANWSRSEAIDLMENWLSSHGNEIDGVIGQNDEMALGAIQAIKLGDYDLDDFATAGIDGVTDAMKAVKEGEHNLSILQDAKAQAQGALDLALREIIGEDYTPKGDLWEDYDDLEWGSEMKEVYNVPWTPITSENVDRLLEERRELSE